MPAIVIVGDQSTSEPGAQEQARKSWNQEVRFRFGEQWADLRNADEIAFACVRSSVENVANRATEALGINSQLKRCQISARPCRARFRKEFGQ